MTVSSWKNQYVELASTMPDKLLSLARNGITDEERQILSSKLSAFGRRIIEIGSGSGGPLIERALQDPDTLYVGIELRYKRAFRTAEKAKQFGVKNIFVIRADISQIIPVLAQLPLTGIYVNFPDPWAKRRWRKHRLLNEEFLKKLGELLSPGGFFSYKTDHAEYFEETIQMLNQIKILRISAISRDLYGSQELLENNIKSEFELLFISQNLPVHYLLAEKIGFA